MWTKEVIEDIINNQPCIECGRDIWLKGKEQFFHKPFCQHGLGLTEKERFNLLEERMNTCHCGKKATGTTWVAYHNLTAVLEVNIVCEDHSDITNIDQRPCGYLHNFISRDISEVQRKLMVLFND